MAYRLTEQVAAAGGVPLAAFALGSGDQWWGPSVSAGYRPYALGPRPISGVNPAEDRSAGDPRADPANRAAARADLSNRAGYGPTRWPAHWVGGGYATPFDDWGLEGTRAPALPLSRPVVPNASGTPPAQSPPLYAKGAPGWASQFSPEFARSWQSAADPRALGAFAQAGRSPAEAGPHARPVKTWSSTLEPTVNPGFVYPPTGRGTVRYNNAPFFIERRPVRLGPPWPVYPTRGEFEGPYGPHALPHYAVLRAVKPGVVYGWPEMAVHPQTGIRPYFMADRSRGVLPSAAYVHAHRAYYEPRVAPRPDTAWPGGQAWASRGPWDYRQERNVRERTWRP